MMHTMISLQVLKEWNACAPALAAFEKVYGDGEVSWTELVVHPACDEEWSYWVRRAVAEYGSAADRKALRNDPNEEVRWVVAEYGSAADRKVLRGDLDEDVRWAVAKYGNAADRAVLRNDPIEYVRWTAAKYGKND